MLFLLGFGFVKHSGYVWRESFNLAVSGPLALKSDGNVTRCPRTELRMFKKIFLALIAVSLVNDTSFDRRNTKLGPEILLMKIFDQVINSRRQSCQLCKTLRA